MIDSMGWAGSPETPTNDTSRLVTCLVVHGQVNVGRSHLWM